MVASWRARRAASLQRNGFGMEQTHHFGWSKKIRSLVCQTLSARHS